MIEHPLNGVGGKPATGKLLNGTISTPVFQGTVTELYEAYLRYRFIFESRGDPGNFPSCPEGDHAPHQPATDHLKRGAGQYAAIIGASAKMQKIIKFIDQVADTNATVLLEGESGTGKELVARALHENSSRRCKPFVSLNCGALTETLLESELFGHIRGSFTGAVQNKKGWFETADGGSIFFDEISEMSAGLQVKLLRILQTGEYSPVGSNEIRKCNVRIIAATNRHLESMIKDGKFRPDL